MKGVFANILIELLLTGMLCSELVFCWFDGSVSIVIDMSKGIPSALSRLAVELPVFPIPMKASFGVLSGVEASVGLWFPCQSG